MAKEKIKKFFESINTYNTYVSIFALIVSFISLIWNHSLQEKNTRFATYNMDLCYQIELSEDIKEEDISFSTEIQQTFEISSSDFIRIVPKIGGIHKISLIYLQLQEDFIIVSFDEVHSDVVEFYEAQDASYSVSKLLFPISGEDEDKYYSSVFLLIEDYNHNFYSNMIILDIDKANFTNIETEVYDEVDLLYTYNKDEDYIDWFDYTQIKKYLKLKNRLDEIL